MIRGKCTLVMIGGGGHKMPALFLFVKTIEKVMRLSTVICAERQIEETANRY